MDGWLDRTDADYTSYNKLKYNERKISVKDQKHCLEQLEHFHLQAGPSPLVPPAEVSKHTDSNSARLPVGLPWPLLAKMT